MKKFQTRVAALRTGLFLPVALLLAAGAACAASPGTGSPASALRLPAPVARAMSGIDAERIRAHVSFLSDDLLEGRGPGVRGGDIAAHYIAAQFEQLGLQPAGDHGSYF